MFYFGCWLLAVGYWPLAVSCWPLAVGCWPSGRRDLNSRGFSNPWNTSRFNYRTVWKTGILIPRDFQVPGRAAVPRFLFFLFVSTDLKVRSYSPSASRLLTSSKLLTLGITQASLALLSLNRNFQTPFSIHPFCFHGLKSPRLFAFGFASCQTPCLCVSCLTVGRI